jgi:murein DD-endopeptidase MepM/ murein hydrolase activator NlpD
LPLSVIVWRPTICESHFPTREGLLVRLVAIFLVMVGAIGSSSIAVSQSTTPEVPPIREDTPYSTARGILLQAGWAPTTFGDADPCRDRRCRGFPEVLACSGVGSATCHYTWQRGDAYLLVWAWGEGQQRFSQARVCGSITRDRDTGATCHPYLPRPQPLTQADYRLPVTPSGRVHGFFDPVYRASENRQHLGVDLPARSGTPVVSPVDGVITANRTTGVAAGSAFLVIRETSTGAEHVLGHVTSTIQPGTTAASVNRGEFVGTVSDWGTNSHVHWGLNIRGVPRSVQSGPGGNWGWGRAPASATESQALARGWVNLNNLTNTAAPGAAFPSPAASDNTTAVQAWLRANPERRLASLADCECESDLPSMWQNWDNHDPYRAEGDFNRDGATDVAFVAIERSGRAPVRWQGRQIFPHWTASLIILNGSSNGRYRNSFEGRFIGAPTGSLLYYNAQANRLVIGPWESSGSSIIARGDTYQVSN